MLTCDLLDWSAYFFYFSVAFSLGIAVFNLTGQNFRTMQLLSSLNVLPTTYAILFQMSDKLESELSHFTELSENLMAGNFLLQSR